MDRSHITQHINTLGTLHRKDTLFFSSQIKNGPGIREEPISNPGIFGSRCRGDSKSERCLSMRYPTYRPGSEWLSGVSLLFLHPRFRQSPKPSRSPPDTAARCPCYRAPTAQNCRALKERVLSYPVELCCSKGAFGEENTGNHCRYLRYKLDKRPD